MAEANAIYRDRWRKMETESILLSVRQALAVVEERKLTAMELTSLLECMITGIVKAKNAAFSFHKG
jgi:hypothetical protein